MMEDSEVLDTTAGSPVPTMELDTYPSGAVKASTVSAHEGPTSPTSRDQHDVDEIQGTHRSGRRQLAALLKKNWIIKVHIRLPPFS